MKRARPANTYLPKGAVEKLLSNFPPSWTEEEDRILRALRPTCTHKEISQVLGELGWVRSQEAVRKRTKILNIKFFEFGAPLDTELTSTLASIRGQTLPPEPPLPVTPAMKSAVTTSQRTSTNKMLEQLREIREEVARTNRWPAVQLEENSDNESLVVLLSDFHVGKVVQDESSRCLFDVAKAIVRIDSLRETVWQILVKNMLVDEVVLILAGDLVDGEGIYPGQEMHLEVHVADQIKAVTTSLWKLITDLSGELKVRVVTCRGNHGRTGLSDEANWDNIVYQQLEILADMQNDSHLAVKNLYGNFNTFEVRGWKGLVRHNAPMQADTGAAIAKFAGWHSIHQYDFLCYGHWHHWGVMTWNGKPLFRNGSLGGGDDYAEGFGAYDYPTQLAFIVSEDELIRNIYPISFKD